MELNNNQLLLLFSFFTLILTPAKCSIFRGSNSPEPLSDTAKMLNPFSTPNAAPAPEPTSSWISSLPNKLIPAPTSEPVSSMIGSLPNKLIPAPTSEPVSSMISSLPEKLIPAPTPEPISSLPEKLIPAPTPSPPSSWLGYLGKLLPSSLSAPSGKTSHEASSAPSPSTHTEKRMLKESTRSNLIYQTVHPYHVPLVARNPELKKICDSTDYPSLCLTFVAPFCKHNSDPISVLEMAIRASSRQIRLTIAATDELVHALAIEMPTAASRLAYCLDCYYEALDNLKIAMEAIPDRDFGTIHSMLSAALTDLSECDDAFVGMTTQYSNYDGHLTKMVSNCIAIASMVK